MKSFLKICVSGMLALSGVNAFAVGPAEQCNEDAKKSFKNCFDKILDAEKVVGGADVPLPNRSQMAEGGTKLAYAGQKTIDATNAAANFCLEQRESYINSCKEKKQSLETKAKGDTPEAQKAQADIKKINSTVNQTDKQFASALEQLSLKYGSAVDTVNEALKTVKASSGSADFANPTGDDDFTWKDAGKWGAIAGLAGVGAMALFGGGSKSGSGTGTSQTSGTGSAGGVGIGTSDPTPAPTVDCTNLSVAVGSASCDTTTVTACTPSNKITTADCQTFSGRYCGLGGSGTGSGTGSTYCKAAMAYSFCGTAGRGQCASCIQVAQWSSPACANNPAEDCKPQFTKAQLITLRDTVPACGSDPINPDIDLWVDANPLLPGPVLPSSIGSGSVGDGRQVASLTVIKPAYSTSLLKANSDSLTKMCKNNELVDCDL